MGLEMEKIRVEQIRNRIASRTKSANGTTDDILEVTECQESIDLEVGREVVTELIPEPLVDSADNITATKKIESSIKIAHGNGTL